MRVLAFVSQTKIDFNQVRGFQNELAGKGSIWTDDEKFWLYGRDQYE